MRLTPLHAVSRMNVSSLRGSSTVERPAVNRRVVGSNPTRGANVVNLNGLPSSRGASHILRRVDTFSEELESGGVQTVPQVTRRWAIRKDMTEVAVTPATADLGAYHPMAAILHVPDMVTIVRFEEARPAGARLELRTGVEQRQAAQATSVDTCCLVMEQRSAECLFRGAFEQHAPLVHAQTPSQSFAVRRADRAEIITRSRSAWAAIFRTWVCRHRYPPVSIFPTYHSYGIVPDLP